MEHVNVERRRQERAEARRRPETSHPEIARDPALLMGTGFFLGSAVSLFLVILGGLVGLSVLVPSLVAVALLSCVLWLLTRKGPAEMRPKLGSEKQLLLAILDAGGSMTPVEAALETSLTVDEAEEILTRFADRGHLVVESRDGALSYTLPGRPTPGTRTV